MKNTLRLAMILSAGLFLAGCATSDTASRTPPPATAWSDKPMSARDHFFFRDLEAKQERALQQTR